jgi:hypothetical protein
MNCQAPTQLLVNCHSLGTARRTGRIHCWASQQWHPGVSASAHGLANINGKNCPDAYTGYFLEWSAGVGVVGVSGETGVFCSGDTCVSGGGGYIGVGIPAELKLCYYTIVSDDITPCACK